MWLNNYFSNWHHQLWTQKEVLTICPQTYWKMHHYYGWALINSWNWCLRYCDVNCHGLFTWLCPTITNAVEKLKNCICTLSAHGWALKNSWNWCLRYNVNCHGLFTWLCPIINNAVEKQNNCICSLSSQKWLLWN